tara:strand:- start:3654 stop:3893 length:240 start_codon:yes stop_codon:yes gene_type:complete
LREKKSLAETHPEIAAQWHLTKNEDLTPYDVTAGSGRKVWWKCSVADVDFVRGEGSDSSYVAQLVYKKRYPGIPVVCSS